MLLQSYDVIQEIQIFLYITAIFFGFQLCIYIFYRYYKIKDERLHLNKILLSYGTFYTLIITGILILATSRVFISNLILKEATYKLGYFLILFSFTALLYFILIEGFSEIINIKVGRILMILNLIPSIIILLVPSANSPLFLFSILFTFANLIFIIIFQIRLVITSKDNIKYRIIKLFTGFLVCSLSLVLISEIFASLYSQGTENLFIFTGLLLLIVGLMINFLGVYDFPAFYEFNWKENLLKFFIIYQKNNLCLYNHDFSLGSNQEDGILQEKQDKILFGSITGIDSIISAITKTEGEKINKIKYGDSYILIEYGSNIASKITYALLVKKDISSTRYFLTSLKKQFESFYKQILEEIDSLEGKEEQLFGSFSIIMKDML